MVLLALLGLLGKAGADPVTPDLAPRAFLALTLTPRLTGKLRGLQEVLAESGERIRWSRPENFHLTLRFLDRQSPVVLEELAGELAKVGESQAPFSLELGGVGSFPFRGSQHPRVLWVGLAQPSGELDHLVETIEGIVRASGLPGDDLGFRAHVTLGRLSRPARDPVLGRLLEEHREAAVGTLEVSSFVLFQVERDATGTRYLPFEVFPLRGDP